ncbi:MAG: Ig-like domain-containing protein [Bacteroidales bacterium]|nr:Ig-like domain-containing protein [Bacteroidales bacterium]
MPLRKIRFGIHPVFLLWIITVMPCTMFGQIKTPFLLRYQTSIQGNLTLISNNVLSVTSTGNYNGTLGNHSVTTVFVDIDSDTGTFNSSNATLALPPTLICPAKKKVFLYWSAADMEDPGGEPDWNFNKVKLKIPGDTAYRIVTADDVIYQGRLEHFYNDPYTCVKDITSIVADDPGGTYWVANVKAKVGSLLSHGGGNTGTSGGWIIVFVYESASLPQKNIAIFDGYVHVATAMVPNPLPFTFSGFQTVPTGDVNVDFLMGALEGDWDLSGDYCQIQKTDGSWLTMSSALRQTNNFFHSIIGLDGAPFLSRSPASENTLGFDADKFPIPNSGNSVIGNNQTSATIRMGTDQEIYGLFLIGLVVDVWYPDILALFTNPGAPGGSGGIVNAGDTVTFSLQTQNKGNDATVNLVQTTVIPPGLDFLYVLQPLPAGVTYYYNATSKSLQFNIPDTLVEVGDPSFTMQYQAKAITDCLLLSDSAISHPTCQFTSSFQGATNPATQTSISSTALSSCGIPNLAPVTLTIIPPPAYPVAVDDTATTYEDTPISIPILANDTDCDTNININSIWIIQGPFHGAYHTIFNSGLVVYTPDQNYHGPDTLRYRVCDFDGLCDTAWVYISVIPVNDPPVVLNDHLTLCMNTSSSGNILTNDSDPYDNTIMTCSVPPVSGPSHGNIILSSTGDFTYTPDNGYYGEDEVVIEVCDSGYPLPPICAYDTLFINITEVVLSNAGPDQLLCLNGLTSTSATLAANFPVNAAGNWIQVQGSTVATINDTASPQALVTNLVIGYYQFAWNVSNGICPVSHDTMTIVVNQDAVADAGEDHNICTNEVFVITEATAGNYLAIHWKTLGTGTFNNPNLLLPIYSPGQEDINLGSVKLVMKAEAKNPCQSASDTMTLAFSAGPEAFAGIDGITCETIPYQVTGAGLMHSDSIKWSHNGKGVLSVTSILSPVYTPGPGENGAVIITLTAYGLGSCNTLNAKDQMAVTVYNQVIVVAGWDMEVEKDSTAYLSGTVTGGSGNYLFQWEPAGLFEENTLKEALTIPLTRDTTLYFIVTDTISGCTDTDSLRIKIIVKPIQEEEDEECLKIYNAITPNGDGLNDIWIIDCIGNYPSNTVSIFDRWGDRINEFENYDNVSSVWRGTNAKNDPVPDGTYYYIVAIKNGKKHTGWVFVRSSNK